MRVKECPLCEQAGRIHSHFFCKCALLTEQDRLYLLKARQIVYILDEECDNPDFQFCDTPTVELPSPTDMSRRVLVRQSPHIDTFSGHQRARVTIDSGATGNMIRLSTSQRLGDEMKQSFQSAHQADGSSPLKALGETRFSLTRGNHLFQFEGLVVENLGADVLAGTPFMEANDITIRPAKRQVILTDNTIFRSGSTNLPTAFNAVRRTPVLRAPSSSTTVWPGDFIEITLPKGATLDTEYALEPRPDTYNA